MIQIKGFSIEQIAGTWTEPYPTISAELGQTVSIIGPGASGKTALCLMVCGLAKGFHVRGHATLGGRNIESLSDGERATLTAYVPTDPSLLFSGVKTTLRGEFEFAWQLLSPISTFSFQDIADAVALFGIEHLLDRDPFTLSGGEAARAAIALALAKKPRVVAIDQSYDNLDTRAVQEIRRAIARILPDTSIVFETFSRNRRLVEMPSLPELSATASETTVPGTVGPWRVHARPRQMDRAMLETSKTEHFIIADSAAYQINHSRTSDNILGVQQLEFQYRQSSFKLGPLNLDIRAGERLALIGPNGVGKTTLLKCLAMLVKPTYREFKVSSNAGGAISPPKFTEMHRWASTVLYCFQNPDDQIYLATVREELCETARRTGVVEASRVVEIAEHFRLTPSLDRSPFELPRPYRRIICIAGALAANTPLLLLDEPSAGLDDAQSQMVAEALLKFRPTRGACVMVSHDSEFVARTATRIMKMSPAISNRLDS
jgi:energy-coupling factor transport system ATP-binding protein